MTTNQTFTDAFSDLLSELGGTAVAAPKRSAVVNVTEHVRELFVFHCQNQIDAFNGNVPKKFLPWYTESMPGTHRCTVRAGTQMLEVNGKKHWEVASDKVVPFYEAMIQMAKATSLDEILLAANAKVRTRK